MPAGRINQGAERNLAAQRSAMKVNDAINMMRDTNTQNFVDFTMQTGLATRGLGGAREAALAGGPNQRGMFDAQSLKDLANVGIKSGQIAALTQSGVNAMGAEFRGVETLQRAGIAQKAGIMTAEQFITQAGTLSTMGGGSDQLEKIMRQAVASGMDNSKNIQQMVSATQALSADMAAAGQDVTGGQADILASQTQTLSDMAVNQRAAVAQRASGFMNEAGGDREMNIFTVQRAAMTRKMLAGKNISFAGFEAAITTEPNTLRDIRSKIQAGDLEEAAKTAQRAGLGEVLVNKQGQVDTDMLQGMEKITRTTTMRRLLTFGKVNKDVEREIMSGVDEGTAFKDLSKDAQDALQALGQTAAGGRVSGQAIFGGTSAIADVKASEREPNTKGDGTAGKIEKAQQIQALAQAKPIIDGMKNLGTNFDKALEKTNKIFGSIADKFDPKEMQNNALEAAKAFETPALNCRQGADKFGLAVNMFADLIKHDCEDNPQVADKGRKMKEHAEDTRDKTKKSRD